MNQPLRVLFVCLGNICRSPLAEVVVKSVADEQGLSHMFHFESAGTGDWHVGNGADPRSASKALEKDLSLADHSAQQITRSNIQDWDVFVAMDSDNRRNLLAMGAKPEQVLMMRAFEGLNDALDVPDPYYGGAHGFEDAYQMLVLNAAGLLEELQKHRLCSDGKLD
ncbi:MAG TPA: low molecular weight phosphotyrosine protein phosphatase [Ghiorsea sp.]|nr:low molecular weight phosphotyrosine protein phosphatase [Ghiorsea sp.]HIP07564.1 low molecular weight phosphotyrosine protein phosphatase [Mariprofundaceae bacterium]